MLKVICQESFLRISYIIAGNEKKGEPKMLVIMWDLSSF